MGNNTLFADLGKRLGIVEPNDTLAYWQELHRMCELLAEFMKTPECFSAMNLSDDEKMDIRWELRANRQDDGDDFIERKTMWTHASLKHEFFKLIENTSIMFADFVQTLPRDEANQQRQALSGFSTLFDLDLDSDDDDDDDDDDEPWRDPELEFFYG